MRKLIAVLLLFVWGYGYGQKRPVRFSFDTAHTKGMNVILTHSYNTIYSDSGRWVAYTLTDNSPIVILDSAGLIRTLLYLIKGYQYKADLLNSANEILQYIPKDGSGVEPYNYRNFKEAVRKYLLLKNNPTP